MRVNRKLLSIILYIVIIFVFSLTIAYAALNAILTISGNADVVASTWDIHLENPIVKSGSATTDLPIITSGRSLAFNTTLNMPGDYYEFTVSVVNDGSIDAMIDRVVKTPELTSEQAKYLKYEVSYANGESINTKQNIAVGVTIPIKVRVEYRKDLSVSDLPTGQVQLTLGLVLDYIQSDGTGSSVIGDGKLIYATGDLNDIGTIVTIGSEQFYTIGTEDNNVKLLSMYNLYVGNSVDSDWNITPLESPTGRQSEIAKGKISGVTERYGTTAFSNNSTTYEGSVVEVYVNNYKTILESDYGVDIIEARLITKDEFTSKDIGCSIDSMTCSGAPSFIYSTSYWTESAVDNVFLWGIYNSNSYILCDDYLDDDELGVRPVIIVSKDYFN